MKIRYTPPEPDLAPDLEWMLASRQVSNPFLLETLINEFYPGIYRLAYSLLDDPQAAQQVTQEIFKRALSEAHRYRGDLGVEIWLYRLAWKVCRRAYRREKLWRRLEKWLSMHGELTNPSVSLPADDFDLVIWHGLDALNVEDRLLLLLRFFLAWPSEKIGRLLDAPQNKVDSRVEFLLERLIPQSGWRGTHPDGFLTQLAGSLQRRWPAQQPRESEPSQLAISITRHVENHKLTRPFSTANEMFFIAAVLVLVLGLIWLGNQLLAGPEPPKVDAPTPVQTRTALQRNRYSNEPPRSYYPNEPLMPRRGQYSSPASDRLMLTLIGNGIYYASRSGGDLSEIAKRLQVSIADLRRWNRIPDGVQVYQGQWLWVPKTPLPTPKPPTSVPTRTYRPSMDIPNTEQELLKIMYPEQLTYRTVWLEALILHNITMNLDQPAQIYRIQLWLMPDQALLIGGPANKDPQEVLLWNGDKNYVTKPGEQMPTYRSLEIDGQPAVDPHLLFGVIMLLKQTEFWDNPGFIYMGQGRYADRETWVIKAVDANRQPLAIVNLDKQTGFVLSHRRLKEYPLVERFGVEVPEEVKVLHIAFDQNFPPELFDPQIPWRGGYALDYTGKPIPLSTQP